MKKSLKELRLPQKVNSMQRPRSLMKEEEHRKPPVPTSELEKLKQFDSTLESLLPQIDPFTTTLPSLASGKTFSDPSFLTSTESKNLFQEFVIDPQKHRKSKSYSGFLESKQRFDIVMNKEDYQQVELLGSRLELYSASLPIPEPVQRMVSFLKHLPQANSILERKKILSTSQSLCKAEQRPAVFTSNIKAIISNVLEQDPPPKECLQVEDKLKLMKIMAKYPEDWEKVIKKFGDKVLDAEVVRKCWRGIKFGMNREIAEIHKKIPQFTAANWLRLARKKLESVNAKKKMKILDVSLKPKEERFDILNVMAEVENASRTGIESSTFLNMTAKSAFKEFSCGDKLQECFLNILRVGC